MTELGDKETLITRFTAGELEKEEENIIAALYQEVPHAYERILCWNFVGSFDRESSLIEKQLDSIIDSSQVCRNTIHYTFIHLYSYSLGFERIRYTTKMSICTCQSSW